MSKFDKKICHRLVLATCLAFAVLLVTLIVNVAVKSYNRAYAIRKLRESGAEIVYDFELARRDLRNSALFSLLFDREDWAPVWRVSTSKNDSKIDLALLASFPEIEYLDLYCVKDADLHNLPALPRVRVILIECRQLTESGFAKLDVLKGVETIVFSGSPCTEQGFRGVPQFPRLKSMSFWETKLSSVRHIGKQGNVIKVGIMDAINDLPAIDLPDYLKIDSLAVSSSDLNISLLDRLSIPGLVDLKLTSDDGWQLRKNRPYSKLEGLSQFPRLKTVKLLGFSISAEWLRNVTARNTVEQLTLSYCDLDPDFFTELSKWRSLKHLDLDRVRIHPTSIASRPPRLDTFKLMNSEVGALNFQNYSSFEQLQQLIIVRNKESGDKHKTNAVQERTMSKPDLDK